MNLFIVESPFQLLCANELVTEYKLENNILLIKLSQNSNNNSQLKFLVKTLNIKGAVFLPHLYKVFLSDMLLCLFLRVVSIKKFNYLAIGEVSSQTNLSFIENLKYNKCLALDDGFHTVIVQDKIQNSQNLYDYIKGRERAKKGIRLLKRLLFLKHNPIRSLDWFTCFNLTPVNNQLIYKNEFNAIKGLLSGSDNETSNVKNVYFLGSPYSEYKVMTLNNELNCIKEFNTSLSVNGKKLIYCVHRRDSEDKLIKIAEIVGDENIRHAQYPIELDLIKSKTVIHELSGFSSTALITLNKIFNIRRTHVIDYSDFLLIPERKKGLVKLQNYLDKDLSNISWYQVNA